MNRDENIGERIRCLRKQRGLTQTALAAQVGLKCSGFSDLERGRNNPTNNLVIQLSKIFNVSTDYLLTGRQLTDKSDAWVISNEEKEILEMYRNDRQVKNALTEILNSKNKLLKQMTNSHTMQDA